MKKVQVGIDLGTTNTLACCRVKGKMQLIKFMGEKMIPSVLYVEKGLNGEIRELVGKTARNKGLIDPDNCIRSSKTYIGLGGVKKKTWICYGKTFTPTDVAERILREVHKQVRKICALEDGDVVQAVITIPAYFTGNQSDETKRAGERAGMEVLRIITEPVAAALSAAEETEGKIFIVDLGGGTFDVSVLEVRGNKFTTLAINGERQLGGDDFDQRLMKYFIEYIEDDLGIDLSSLEASGLSYETYYVMMAKIRNAAEEMKKELSDDDEAEVNIPNLFTYGSDHREYDFSISMTRDEFNDLCSDLFHRIMDVIQETMDNGKKFRKDEIKKVFLVGGSCYIPKVQEDVENYFGMSADAQQDRATQVVLGAGKLADAWYSIGTGTGGEIIIADGRIDVDDIISHSMGVAVFNETKREMEFSCILEEGTHYPCNHQKKYYTVDDNQTSVVIKVYEKVENAASDSLKEDKGAFDFYGSFVLDGLKPAPAGDTPIEITFDYDISRTLTVTAEDKKSHEKKEFKVHKGERDRPKYCVNPP